MGCCIRINRIHRAGFPYLPGGFLASACISLRQQRGLARLPHYLASNRAWFERARGQLAGIDSAPELARCWHQELAPHLLTGVWTVLGTVSQAANTMLALRRKLEALVGPQDANLLIANLNAGEPGAGLVESLASVAGLAQVAAGGMNQADYLAKYGHRGPHEFEISIPRPAEDPSWTVLFPRAAAVVTEVGAPLSHAAIVARELGIPAVVGCRNATRQLKTGDLVQVDGGLGEVRRIEDLRFGD